MAGEEEEEGRRQNKMNQCKYDYWGGKGASCNFISLCGRWWGVSHLKSLKCIIKLHPISTLSIGMDAKVITKGRSVQLKKVLSLTFLKRECALVIPVYT